MARTENGNGDVITEDELVFGGETSIFEGTIELSPESRQLVVIASQPEEANFGRAERKL